MKLPVVIKRILEPIFRDLSSDDLLAKCLHGQTQNANEAFNAILWQKCPKEVFVGKDTVELAAFSAVINYNEGFFKTNDVYQQLKLPISRHFAEAATKKDRKRIANSDIKSSEKCKKQRKRLRATRKGFIDTEKETEGGDSYQSGTY